MATKAKLPSTAVGRRRLLKLAGLLEADAKNKKGIRFDLQTWGQISVLDYREKPDTIPVNCGTEACAVGLACISGTFKREGLTYRIDTKNVLGGNNFKPVFGRHSNFPAVDAFFQIRRRESEFLFAWGSYDIDGTGAEGERAVAKRIRDFVAGKAAP